MVRPSGAAATMSNLSRNAECVLRILKTADSLTTSEILELAKQEQFADICTDCAGGDAFIAAANELVERGLISKKFGKGGYRWSIVRE
ncbi:MAG: hypothetical protein ACTSVD_04375 [Candidatus Thorarchaeota archaeon]|nr:MAG: hypothetical protein DRO93_01710 [Candidatus Thorarchaeota archaeon]